VIAEISTFTRVRGGENLTGLVWRCKPCGTRLTFRGVKYLYQARAAGHVILMTWSVVSASVPRHALVHTCGADVDAVPLWRRPEWS
jgi:hypothetical protein